MLFGWTVAFALDEVPQVLEPGVHIGELTNGVSEILSGLIGLVWLARGGSPATMPFKV